MSWVNVSVRAAAVGALLLGAAAASPARADLSNCTDIYVIQMYVHANGGTQVVFGTSATDTFGSHWQNLGPGMTEAVYQRFYSMLLTAKASKARVLVQTNGTGNCSISAGTHDITSLYLRSTL